VQESSNIYVVSAILAYAMNPNLWQNPPQTCWRLLPRCAKNRLDVRNHGTEVGYNPSLTSWRDLIRILLSFRWFHIVVVVVIVCYKKEDHRGSN